MLIPYLMKVSLVLAVLTLAYRWLIQFETFSKLNRVLLWLNVAAAWTLPLINLPSWGPVGVQTDFHHSIPKVVGKLPILSEPIATIQSQPSTAPAEAAIPEMTAADWISAIYLSGMLVMAVYLLFQIGRLFLMVAKGRKQAFSDGTSVVHIAGASPFSFFKWIVLDSSRHSGRELHNIIAHEAEHARQWHSADLLLAEIQKICLWFNPFAWLHQKLVQENLEYLADRAVLDNGFEKKQYQYNLLNAVLQARELPLTNSFAQSLLKKRIQMMNRKPSHYLVWGKYVAVLALIYVSSAFVAPYREQIVELAPEVIRPLVKPLVGEVIAAGPARDSVTTTAENAEASPIPLHVKLVDEVPDTIQNSQVKGILIRNDTLYWAITPMMNWDVLTEMRRAVNKFGGEFSVYKIQYDPLRNFIASFSVVTRSASGSSGTGRSGENEFTPIQGYSGYLLSNGIGMNFTPPAALRQMMKEDYDQAMLLKKQNEVEYFEYKLIQEIGPFSQAVFQSGAFSGPNAKNIFVQEGVGKSATNKLLLADTHKNDGLYMDTGYTTLEELNRIPIERVEKVSLITGGTGKKYVIVYSK